MNTPIETRFSYSLFANARMNGFLTGIAHNLGDPSNKDFNPTLAKKILEFVMDINECQETRFVNAQELFFKNAKTMYEQISRCERIKFDTENPIRRN